MEAETFTNIPDRKARKTVVTLIFPNERENLIDAILLSADTVSQVQTYDVWSQKYTNTLC